MLTANGQLEQPEERSRELSSNAVTEPATVVAEVEQSICHNGHLLLHGKNGEQYLTRYHIDHVQQSQGLCRSIVLNECFPCCTCQPRRTVCGCLWAFARSEMLIFVLQLISLFLGAFKECESLYLLTKSQFILFFVDDMLPANVWIDDSSQ
jgi:hypothetical protein